LVKDITEIVIKQQSDSLKILKDIESQLEKENIIILNETQVDEDQAEFIKDYFIQTVSPELVTIILNDLAEFPLLKDTSGYLAIKLVMKTDSVNPMLHIIKKKNKEIRYALIEIPRTFNRILVLPSKNGKQYIMLLDDVIRYNLSSIFNIFDY